VFQIQCSATKYIPKIEETEKENRKLKLKLKMEKMNNTGEEIGESESD
jgi:hypothetical protein